MNHVDRDALEKGSFLWSYGQKNNFTSVDQFWEFICTRLLAEDGVDIAALRRRLFGWFGWAEAGFPLIDIDSNYAAALAASRSAEEASQDLVVPYTAFCVRLPRGLLEIEASPADDYPPEASWERPIERVNFDRVFLMPTFYRLSPDSDEKFVCGLFLLDSQTGYEQQLFAGNVGDLLLGVNYSLPDTPSKRVMILARRIVIGALYTMHFTTNFTTRDRKLKRHIVGRNGPPTHRVTTIGRPISVDCKPWVRAYLAGEVEDGASPMFQSLVRGHFKRQVVGVGRLSRKVIWIEPYWRGPEDAPILVRPHRVGGGLEDQDGG